MFSLSRETKHLSFCICLGGGERVENPHYGLKQLVWRIGLLKAGAEIEPAIFFAAEIVGRTGREDYGQSNFAESQFGHQLNAGEIRHVVVGDE